MARAATKFTKCMFTNMSHFDVWDSSTGPAGDLIYVMQPLGGRIKRGVPQIPDPVSHVPFLLPKVHAEHGGQVVGGRWARGRELIIKDAGPTAFPRICF